MSAKFIFCLFLSFLCHSVISCRHMLLFSPVTLEENDNSLSLGKGLRESVHQMSDFSHFQIYLPSKEGWPECFCFIYSKFSIESSQPSLNNGMPFYKDNSMSTASLLSSTRLWKETNILLKHSFFILKLTVELVPIPPNFFMNA